MIFAADPASSPWFYLANFGAVGVILGAILLAVARDKWGSHSERDRLRQVADKVFLEVLPLLQREKERGEQVIAHVTTLTEVVKDLSRLRDEMERERDRDRFRREGGLDGT